MKMRINNQASKYILSAFVVVFSLLGLISLFKFELIAADRIVAAVFCTIFIFINRKYIVRPLTAFIAGLIFVPHLLGLNALYGANILNYHYDWIVHTVSAFCATIVILDFLMQNGFTKQPILKKFVKCAVIALTITITFGTIMELTEYWGFYFVGFGEGYLGFGDGDNSENFGPWENSSWDNSFNFLGSISAIVLYGADIIISRKLLKNH